MQYLRHAIMTTARFSVDELPLIPFILLWASLPIVVALIGTFYASSRSAQVRIVAPFDFLDRDAAAIANDVRRRLQPRPAAAIAVHLAPHPRVEIATARPRAIAPSVATPHRHATSAPVIAAVIPQRPTRTSRPVTTQHASRSALRPRSAATAPPSTTGTGNALEWHLSPLSYAEMRPAIPAHVPHPASARNRTNASNVLDAHNAMTTLPRYLNQIYTGVRSITQHGDRATVQATLRDFSCTVTLHQVSTAANVYGWTIEEQNCTKPTSVKASRQTD